MLDFGFIGQLGLSGFRGTKQELSPLFVKFVSVILVVVLLISACTSRQPVPTELARVRAQSNYTIIAKAYEIPRGIFRGVLWPEPTEKEKNFVLWVIDETRHNRIKWAFDDPKGFLKWVVSNKTEHYFKIPAPPGFKYPKDDAAEKWEIAKTSNTARNQVTYSIKKSDGSKAFQLDLPVKKREFQFETLTTTLGPDNSYCDEIVIFMDLSENIVDTGLFGYVLIGNKAESHK